MIDFVAPNVMNDVPPPMRPLCPTSMLAVVHLVAGKLGVRYGPPSVH